MPPRRIALRLAPAVLLFLFACATPPPPAGPRACNAAGPDRPRFDPLAGRCDCVTDPPSPWQAAAPRGGSEAVREKQAARIALRRVGTADFTQKDVAVLVIAPSGGVASSDGVVAPPEWVILRYPDDFPLGTYHRVGVYTVLWTVDASIVACDGFAIEPREAPAAADEPEPAP